MYVASRAPSWVDISSLCSLQRVILSSNRVEQIDALGKNTALTQVTHLSLGSNVLKNWECIDSLHPWFPGLESLNLSGNPLVEGINTLSNLDREY